MRKNCGVSVATLLLFILLTAKHIGKQYNNNSTVLITHCSVFVATRLAFVYSFVAEVTQAKLFD